MSTEISPPAPEIASPSDPSDPIYVNKVFHKAYVKIDEIGTEASAGVAASVSAGAELPSGKPVEFRADHPFLFFIRHRPSGIVLFMGRVNDPIAR